MASPKGWVDPEADLVRTHFTPKSGVWDNPKHWSLKKLPDGYTRAYIPGGSTCTLAATVHLTDGIIVGDTPKKTAILYIENGSHIVLANLSVPHLTATDSAGTVYMRGGELVMENDEDKLGMLTIGSSGSTSGVGTFEISGGSFKGGIMVGSNLPNTHMGTLSVVGSAASIGTCPGGRNNLFLFSTGTLRFVPDKDGVSTLDFSEATLTGLGGKIVVDGSSYFGGSARMVLIKAKNFAYKPTVEMANFPKGYKVSTEYDTKEKPQKLMLKISKGGQ